MSSVLRSLLIKVGVDLTEAQKGFKKAAREFKRSGKELSDMGGSLTTGLTVPILGIGAALALTVKDAANAETHVAQLEAVLKSTGGAAGVTKEQALGLADAFEQTTKFTAESTLEAESMLLTFTKIGSQVFPDTVKIALDMATAMGTDASAGAIQLGKALNDPVTGISALSRVGVTFTDQQKSMIKKLVESGDIMGAQKIILKELQTEFGGSAEAAGKTFAGQLEILKNKLGAATEKIGSALMPVLLELQPLIADKIVPAIEQICNSVVTLISRFDNLSPQSQNIVLSLIALALAIGPLVSIAGKLSMVISGVMTAFSAASAAISGGGGIMAAIGALMGPVGWVILAIVAIAAAAYLIITNWEPIKAFFINLWTTVSTWFVNTWTNIQTFFTGLWAWIQGFFAQWGPLILAFIAPVIGIPLLIMQNWDAIKQFFIDLWNSVAAFFTVKIPEIIASTVQFFTELPEKIAYAIGFVIGRLISWGISVGDWIKTNVPILISSIVTFFSELPGKIWAFLVKAVTDIGTWGLNMLAKAKAGLTTLISNIVTYFSELPGKIWAYWTTIVIDLTTWATNMKNKIATAAPEIIAKLVGFFAELPGKIIGIGRDIVEGLWSGINNSWDWLKNKVTGLFGNLVKGIKDGLGIASPSKVFKKIGGFVSDGLALGISGGTKNVIGSVKDLAAGAIAAFDRVDLSASARLSMPEMATQVVGANNSATKETDQPAANNITINLNGNYSFRDKDDIDFLMNRMELAVRRAT